MARTVEPQALRPSAPGGLLAWCAGAALVQALAALPPLVPCALSAVALLGAAHHARRKAGRCRRLAAWAAAWLACALAGVAYATWRAEQRLADALPPAWEGEDVEIVGVVDDLPRAAVRGVRFAFAVERVLTPGASVP
ncbi:MAG TPA: DUF4131 domain-containing protein, partial [Casimicrobiaceae bacterium]|nr:DUF4131 domain-containing protein [Casimicrobiaceae bacterium]